MASAGVVPAACEQRKRPGFEAADRRRAEIFWQYERRMACSVAETVL
jgi:hypothetical protein